MAFGKKKTGEVIDQSQVELIASRALAERRRTRNRLAIRLTFDTPMMMNQFSQKALVQMLSKQVGVAVAEERKDLTQTCAAAVYRNEKDAVVIPCRLIKAAIVEGAIVTSGAVTKADLKRLVRVLGWTSPVHLNGELAQDVRIARNSNGNPDVRGRSLVPAGSYVEVVVEFPSDFSPDKIVAAADGAGAAIGIGDWRPDSGGDFGTFSVEILKSKEIDRIIHDCSVPERLPQVPEFLMRAVGAIPSEKLPDPVRKGLSVSRSKQGEKNGTPATT